MQKAEYEYQALTEQEISEGFLSQHSLDHIVLKLWGFMLDFFEDFKM